MYSSTIYKQNSPKSTTFLNAYAYTHSENDLKKPTNELSFLNIHWPNMYFLGIPTFLPLLVTKFVFTCWNTEPFWFIIFHSVGIQDSITSRDTLTVLIHLLNFIGNCQSPPFSTSNTDAAAVGSIVVIFDLKKYLFQNNTYLLTS